MRLIAKNHFKTEICFIYCNWWICHLFLSYYLLYVFTVEDSELDSNLMALFKSFYFLFNKQDSRLRYGLKSGILEQAHPEYILHLFIIYCR